MPYIGAGIQRFNTADGLTVSGSTDLDGAVVVNESSADADFRVESNGNTNMLFVDAGNDKVAVGTGTAVGTLTTECTAGNSNFALTAYHPTSTSSRTIAKFQSDVGSTQADKVTIGCDGSVTTTGALDVTTSTHANASVFKSTGNTQLFLQDTDASSDDQFWGLQVSGGDFNILTCDDDRSGGFVTPLTIAQAGGVTVASSIQFGSDAQTKVAGAGSSDVDLLVSGDTNIRFETSTNEQMRIDNSGKVSVGTTSASGRAHVKSDASEIVTFIEANASSYTGEILYVQTTRTANSTHRYFKANENGGAATSIQIVGNGDVQNANNSYTAISDERIKQNITDANSQWDDIKALKVKNFKLKYRVSVDGDDAPTHIGVVAQDLESAGMNGLIQNLEPDPYQKDTLGIEEDVKSVKYSVLYMKAVKALQEAMTRIETLETKVAALEAG